MGSLNNNSRIQDSSTSQNIESNTQRSGTKYGTSRNDLFRVGHTQKIRNEHTETDRKNTSQKSDQATPGSDHLECTQIDIDTRFDDEKNQTASISSDSVR
jgi:hypothetical protein